MTTGMLADDEGLLTKQDAADLLQVAVDAASLAAERHWAALSGDQPTGALPESRRPTMGDRKPPGRIPKPEPLATWFLSLDPPIRECGRLQPVPPRPSWTEGNSPAA